MPASSPPAPPSRCPVIDFVPLTFSFAAQRVLAKHQLDRLRLVAVARRRRRGMRIHIAHFFRLDARIFQRRAHAALRALRPPERCRSCDRRRRSCRSRSLRPGSSRRAALRIPVLQAPGCPRLRRSQIRRGLCRRAGLPVSARHCASRARASRRIRPLKEASPRPPIRRRSSHPHRHAESSAPSRQWNWPMSRTPLPSLRSGPCAP